VAAALACVKDDLQQLSVTSVVGAATDAAAVWVLLPSRHSPSPLLTPPSPPADSPSPQQAKALGLTKLIDVSNFRKPHLLVNDSCRD